MVDYVPLAEALFGVVETIVCIVSFYVLLPVLRDTVIPWLKEKRILTLVAKFVQAAEKLASTGVIPKEAKKGYVLRLLEQKGVNVTPDIDAFVESAVLDLDKIFTDGLGIIVEEMNKADCEQCDADNVHMQNMDELCDEFEY